MPPLPAPVPFGKYLLLEKIASGGMAEVFRAVLRGAAGFEKQVAVKRILPVFCEEPEFVTLFQDEARIASTLAHANIAQVFELGEQGGSYYLVLELVEGLDLAKIMGKLKAAGQPMPLATAAFIVAEAARGLAYAHDKTTADGRRIGLVHRDVSPPNILCSRSGDVKVADFGIAKAVGKVHKTETGVIMGKLRYMSPEQVAGEELDGRSDIWSLGVILYELLAGGSLWPSDQTLRLAELIQKAEIPPPSSRNPAVTPDLDAIALRALARPREARYARAADLARDLSMYLSTSAPGFSREDLAALVSTMAPPAAVATAPTELHSLVEVAPAAAAVAPRPETLNLRRRRGWSATTWIGLVLGAIILGSMGLVLIRFLWPAGEGPARPDAARLVLALDAGPRGPEPVPTAAFTLAPTASVDERAALGAAIEGFPVARRGLPFPDYAAFVTGLDCAVAGLVLDAQGHALEPAGLPPQVDDLVQRAGVRDALDATVAYLRATGELPPLVRDGLRNLLGHGPSTVDSITAQSMPGNVSPYSASLLALWLDPKGRGRLADLAYANGVLERWCVSPPAPLRHFAPMGCEPTGLVAALRAADPGDGTARAIERWMAAPSFEAADAGVLHVRYEETAQPDTLILVVELAGPAPAELLASGKASIPLAPLSEVDDVVGANIPRRLAAPVLKVGDALMRLPPPPFLTR